MEFYSVPSLKRENERKEKRISQQFLQSELIIFGYLKGRENYKYKWRHGNK